MFSSRSSTRSFGTPLDSSSNIQALSTPKKQTPNIQAPKKSLVHHARSLLSSKSGQREINELDKLDEEKTPKKCEKEPSSSLCAADDDFVQELKFKTHFEVPKHDDAAIGIFETFLDQLKSHGLEECHGILFASGFCRISGNGSQ